MSRVPLLRLLCLTLAGCHAQNKAPVNLTQALETTAQSVADAGPSVPPSEAAPSLPPLGEALAAAPPLDPETAAWLPPRVLSVVRGVWGAPPAPRAPDRGPEVRWVLQASRPDADPGAACAALAGAGLGVLCRVTPVVERGAERPAITVAWRAGEGAARVTRGQLLRALGRAGASQCLVAMTLGGDSVEARVRVRDYPTLGAMVAELAVGPGLSGLIVGPPEAVAEGLEVRIGWPLSRRVEGADALGDDPWPERCHARLTLASAAPSGSLPRYVAPIVGARARGAWLALGREVFAVTAGDQLGESTLVAVEPARVTVRRSRQARDLVIPLSPPSVASP